MWLNFLKRPVLFLVLNAIIINAVVLLFLNKNYPLVGHDYGLAIPQMLDSALHFRLNGLNIQWYTPAFGGGLPAFPDPNNIQFSILGILTIWFEPWWAVGINSIFFITLGLLASYRFFRLLNFHYTSAILGAVFFSTNGFIMERMAVGHLGYQPFPMLAVFLVILLDDSIPVLVAALLFSLAVSLLIHQAGYFLIVTFGLSFLIIFPLIFLMKRDIFSVKRILLTVLGGGLVAALICASKLSAIYSFMRYFPRIIADQYQPNLFLGIMAIFFQILGTMNLVPISWMSGHDPNLLPNNMAGLSGLGYGYWEYDMSLSPIVFFILLAGINLLIYQRKRYKKIFVENKRWIAWLAMISSVWLCMEFILARGLFYPYLRLLPIIGSLHVNNRFTSALLFPLVFLAVYIYNRWVVAWTPQKAIRILIAANLLTILPTATYFTFNQDLQKRTYDVSSSILIHQSILEGKNLEITQIGIGEWENNTQVFLDHTSNLNSYAPIFGYQLETFHPEIKPGSVWDLSDNYYNMTNPSGYVFPDVNASRPFERIPSTEKDRLETFVNHRQPNWNLPIYQQAANWISVVSFLLVLGALGLFSFIAVKNQLGWIKPHA
jgi:hypothetical protein